MRIETSETGPGSSSPADDSEDPTLEIRAAIAATWTARQKFEVSGRRELFGAGFHDGLHAALRDLALSDWDFREGFDAGRHDPRAARIGSEIGEEEAARAALETATAHVTAQFCESSSEPRPEPLPAAPAFAASLPEVRAPRMVEVFDQFPLDSFRPIDVDPLPDPWRLYRSTGYENFYNWDWTDPERAFEYWLSHHRDKFFWRQLSAADAARFADLFRGMYKSQLRDYAAGAGERAYGRGFGEGWDYGSLIAREWVFRQGYREGFEEALAEHAAAAFRERYPRQYEERYRKLFGDWATAAPPELRETRTRDAAT